MNELTKREEGNEYTALVDKKSVAGNWMTAWDQPARVERRNGDAERVRVRQ